MKVDSLVQSTKSETAYSGWSFDPILIGKIRSRVLIFATLLLAGCANPGIGVWQASDIEMQTMSPVRLVNQGQTVGFISKEKLKFVMEVKRRIQEVVAGVSADLLIASPKEPNAFATTFNGRPVIGITLGMLELAGWDRHAYATLIGHEYAHLALDHGSSRTQREGVSRAIGEALGLVLSQAGVPLGGTLANLTVTAIERTYTRDEEREADKLGFDYLVKAGFDPGGPIRLWEKMKDASSGFSIPFLGTHPLSQERIETMRALASAHYLKAEAAQQVTESVPSASEAASSAVSGGANEPALLTYFQSGISAGNRVSVSMEPLGLYNDPSTDSRRIEHIYKRDTLVVEEIAENWIKVRAASGSRGWIMRRWVRD